MYLFPWWRLFITSDLLRSGASFILSISSFSFKYKRGNILNKAVLKSSQRNHQQKIYYSS